MSGSDSGDNWPDPDDLRKRISRRQALLGTVAVGGGLFFALQSGNQDQQTEEDILTGAEERLVQLAATVNDADLKDPLQTSGLRYDVKRGVDEVNSVIDQPRGDKDETRQRIVDLEVAVNYYRQLASTLQAANTVQKRAADSEDAVLYPKEDPGDDPYSGFEISEFTASVTQLEKTELKQNAGTAQVTELVPEPQQVVDSLRTREKVFEQHRDAQQAYIETSTPIEEGIRAQEQSRFDAARSTLIGVQQSLDQGIPAGDYQYRLSDAGLSLQQYETILTLRRQGVEKLLDVSVPSVTAKERRSASNEAIDLFFEARGQLTR